MAETPEPAQKDRNAPSNLTHPLGDPVATPTPSIDDEQPVAKGSEEVEKFLVITDTGGGD